MNVVLNDGPIHGRNPSGTLAKRCAPPVTLLLAATIPAEFVPPEHQQGMSPAASDVLHGFRIQLVPQIVPVVHALHALASDRCRTGCGSGGRYIRYN